MHKCLFWLIAFCFAASAQTNEIREILSRPLLRGEKNVAASHLLRRVEEADFRADRMWREVADEKAFYERCREMQKRMVSSVGGFPARSPLNSKRVSTERREGYRIDRILFDSLPGVRVPGLLYVPNGEGPFPGILILCGHSDEGKGEPGYQRAAVLGVQAGFAVLLIDPLLQGERGQGIGIPMNVHGHNHFGVRASLLGWSAARFRIWDAMRGLDFLAAHQSIDPKRLGVMGNSGGGTMTSLLMALDSRVRSAAPSCYLSSLREVVGHCGPQDAEQNLFGQLKYGLNHAGYLLLRAPSPVCMMCKEKDFFPIAGSVDTADLVTACSSRFGFSDAFSMVRVPGPHGWVESTRQASVDWMTMWLKENPRLFRVRSTEGYEKLDERFDLKKVDCGLRGREAWVTPKGQVLHLSGERSVYDLLQEEMEKTPQELPAERLARKKIVQQVAQISDQVRVRWNVISTKETERYQMERAIGILPDGAKIPVVCILHKKGRDSTPLLFVSDQGRSSVYQEVDQALQNGRSVMVADLSGFGETAGALFSFYRHPHSDEGLAMMHYLLGENLVSKRAEEIGGCVTYLSEKCGSGVELRAFGRACIPAAHAFAVFSKIDSFRMADPPLSWRNLFTDRKQRGSFADHVRGAMRAYDWIQLGKSGGRR